MNKQSRRMRVQIRAKWYELAFEIYKIVLAENEVVKNDHIALLKFQGRSFIMECVPPVEQMLPILEGAARISLPQPGDPYSKPRARLMFAASALAPKYGLACPVTPPKIKKIKAKKVWIKAKGGRIIEGEIQAFYRSYEWRKVRYFILMKYGKKCMCCGDETPPFHVDHIKPLRKFWALRLDPDNLQVLCDICNHGKGNWDQTDFRPVGVPDPKNVRLPNFDQEDLAQANYTAACELRKKMLRPIKC